MVSFSVRELSGHREILAGALNGKRLFAKLIECSHEPTMFEVAFLNFAEINVATGSFLRESVIAFRDYCRQRESKLFPVVANMSDDVRDELDFLLTAKGDVMLACSTNGAGQPFNVGLIGLLDQKARNAFSCVQGLGETDASRLQQQNAQTDVVTINAWNNRLAGLCARRLLVEETRGRTKFYRPVLTEA